VGGQEEIKYNIDFKNFIHRGSMIKNSGKLFALIVYTGLDSKIMLN
jgi:hypothetical protein